MKEDKMIQVPATEFKQMQETIAALAGKVNTMEKGDAPKIMRTPKVYLVTVSFLNNAPVIGYVNKGTKERPLYIYEAPNPQKPTEYILFVDLILKGQENPVKVLYSEFMEHAERHECPILNIRKEIWTDESAGQVTKKEVPDGAYYTEDAGIIVPLEVRGEIRFFKVRLPDLSEIELHERYVNISK